MAKQTPLFGIHQQLGARVIDFNGWDMPVQYKSGILAEHEAVRTRVGIFDTCHMGEFRLRATDVREVLNRLLAGDFRALKEGRMRYTFLTAEDGTVVDDAVVFLVSAQEAMICVNAGDIPGDFAFLRGHLPVDAELIDESAATGKLDVQGPQAAGVILALLGIDFRTMPFYSFVQTSWDGVPLLLSRSGYTGSPGVELFIAAERVGDLWAAILAAGKTAGSEVMPCGLGARDTLRLEAGMPLYGHELTRSLNPLQAGFAKFVSLDKPQDFPGRAALQGVAGGQPQRVLAGLEILDRRVARQGFALLQGGRTVGEITSGGPAPTVGGNIALCYVEPSCAQPGTELCVEIRGAAVPARVAQLPFFRCEELRGIVKKQG